MMRKYNYTWDKRGGYEIYERIFNAVMYQNLFVPF